MNTVRGKVSRAATHTRPTEQKQANPIEKLREWHSIVFKTITNDLKWFQ